MLNVIHAKNDLALRTPADRLEERIAIEKQIRRFLESGGKINKFPMGMMKGEINRPLNLKSISATKHL